MGLNIAFIIDRGKLGLKDESRNQCFCIAMLYTRPKKDCTTSVSQNRRPMLRNWQNVETDRPRDRGKKPMKQTPR
jgi:hypothetical protein